MLKKISNYCHHSYLDSSIEVEIDLCNPENFQEIFQELMYDPDKYTRYQGLDHTSLFASSVTLSDKYAVIGSNGYGIENQNILIFLIFY